MADARLIMKWAMQILVVLASQFSSDRGIMTCGGGGGHLPAA